MHPTDRSKILLKQFSGLPVIGLMAAVLAGCAAPEAARQIRNFSEATVLTADNAKQAFGLVEEVRFREEVSVEVLDFDRNIGFKPEGIQPFISTNALKTRLQVLDGLKSYAANLSALVGNPPLENLDLETTRLARALTNLDATVVKESFFKSEPVSDRQIDIFTTAINSLGHWLIAGKQHEDAKKAVVAMQKPVADICNLLQMDFRILGRQLANDRKATLRNENQYLLNNLNQFDQNPGDKRAEIQEMAALEREMSEDAHVFSAMESSVADLARAHESLAEVFSHNTTDVRALIDQFSAESRRISKYYHSLR